VQICKSEPYLKNLQLNRLHHATKHQLDLSVYFTEMK